MKRFFSFFLVLLAALALEMPARADMLWTPDGNRFYENHVTSCDYIGREYYANGGAGFVTLWDAPGGSVVEAQYENGTRLRVYWQYRDWGCVTVFTGGGKHIDGWVPMSDLYLIYDHISFEEEYGEQFRPYNGEFADYDGQLGEEIWLWETPLDGTPKEVTELRQEFLDAFQGGWDNHSYISKIYTDEAGRNWGFVSYMFGYRDFWILLDDPTCAGVEIDSTAEAEELIAAGEIIAPQPPRLPSASYTPYILVAAVVIVTAGLIFWFYGRSRKNRT